MSGYHLSEIPKGVVGEFSKIEEEFYELKDALEQGNKVMSLVELSDLIGAIKLYLEKEYGKSIEIYDLMTMAKATQRAFECGDRK